MKCATIIKNTQCIEAIGTRIIKEQYISNWEQLEFLLTLMCRFTIPILNQVH